jgi:hypothetical protein
MITGGPAFPIGSNAGMSLRDWFAGQAMVGILANDSDPSPEQVPHIVASAYILADAMLSQREKS